MFNNTQKKKIKNNLSGKNLLFFFLWVIIFLGINIYFNDLLVLGFDFLYYENYIKIPYIIFGILNTFLIGLSINLLIDKMKEIKTLNPKTGFFSFIGTFLALLTGACPGCVAGIFPVFIGLFGSNISMYSLPFHGAEIQLLSFVFLIIGIYFLSLNMTCKLKPKLKIMGKIKLIIISLLGIIGSLDAAYLTSEAYKIKDKVQIFGGGGEDIGFICDVNSVFSCSSVFNENFAWILGIPFSGIALAVYPILVIIALLGLFGKIKNHFKMLFILSIGGLLFNIYIIINESLIGAYCLLCLLCTAIIITILTLSILGLKDKNEK
ncbi:MAG: vitamin K epoxide reductase family protein [Candidatus Gracilibacteria bacterium]|nr:vitamin K epoxide reductase family protein [Candidatus Gracilibacteria bacterium]